MHGTSHHMGLDTHDFGALKTPMKANMVFTVEPGIYIPEEKWVSVWKMMLLFNQKEYPLAMKNIPIDDEIEMLMNIRFCYFFRQEKTDQRFSCHVQKSIIYTSNSI